MSTNYDAMTDAELSEAFAVKVAGWVQMDCSLWDVGESRDSSCSKRSDGKWISNSTEHFATSADAVLPWLEKHPDVEIYRDDGRGWCIAIMGINRLSDRTESGIVAESWEPTFPRAACIALLRAKDAETAHA